MKLGKNICFQGEDQNSGGMHFDGVASRLAYYLLVLLLLVEFCSFTCLAKKVRYNVNILWHMKRKVLCAYVYTPFQ